MQSYMRLIIITLLILSFIFVNAQNDAQKVNVTFKIITTAKEAIGFATITVISVPDTVHQQTKISDSSGTVIFLLERQHPYLVRVSVVNHEPFEKAITVKGDRPTFTFTIDQFVKSLKNVIVNTTRPIMRQEDDKTIVDPENLASSSTNAYEIIEKTPGLFVDQDGNIYLSSTTPATIYINGREQKMSTSDIATMLKNLPPTAIASIEILRTPSAKYDATASGGIVNVILKKGIRIGLTGSIITGFSQGIYGNKYIGFNLSNNNGRLTTYINTQYGRRSTYEQIRTNRIFSLDSVLRQDAYTRYPGNSYYIGYGAGYELTKKWDLNYDGRLSYNTNNNKSINRSVIEKISTSQVSTSNTNFVQNKINNINITQGINAKYKIDSSGSEWTTDFSFTYAPYNATQIFSTLYEQPTPGATGGDGDINNNFYFFSAQTNLQKKFPARKITIETGIKSTNVHFSNSTDYFRELNGIRTNDFFRTRSYTYNENINAAYLQASKNISGIIIKIGSRMENTNMKGHQLIPGDTSFTLHRTDLFPYIYISKTVMKIAGYDLRAYLVFRRTISRPAYEYLNPFPRYIDEYLYESGNPSLRPQFTKNYEANVSVDERPIVAIGYNDTKDIFTQVIYQSDTNSRLAYRTYDNLGSNKETYIRLLGAIPPGKRYFFVVGAQYNHNFYNGLYESKPLRFKKGSWTIFTYQTFRITKLMQITLNGFARFNGQQQFYELSTFGALNMSLSQQFLQKKLIISLNASDIFFTNKNEFSINQGTVKASGMRQGDTRRFGLNFRYNFGIRKKEENNIFNLESPERTN
jgi:iron complex outermembrane receptor protein